MVEREIPMSDRPAMKGFDVPIRKRTMPTKPHHMGKKKKTENIEITIKNAPVMSNTTMEDLVLSESDEEEPSPNIPTEISQGGHDEITKDKEVIEITDAVDGPNNECRITSNAIDVLKTTYLDTPMQTDTINSKKISAQTDDPCTHNHQSAPQKLRELAKSQQTKVILEVGNQTFMTSASILSKEESVLSRMVKKHSPLQPYFTSKIMTYSIDRDPLWTT